jgi:hypothetical protein
MNSNDFLYVRGGRRNLPVKADCGNSRSAAAWLALLLGAGTVWADQVWLQSPIVRDQHFSFVFGAQSNATYLVEYATTLSPPNWTTAFSVAGSNCPVTFTDTNGIGAARFYRVAEGGGLTIPAAQVRAVASGLYDQIQQQQSFDPAEVSLFFSVFGIATVGSSNETAFEAAVAAQQPFMLDFQVQAIANKLCQSWYVTWDSFIAQMADLGAVDNSGQPLSRAYLTAQFEPLLTKEAYTYRELLPALVLALGQERASRSSGPADPVLGDDLMDPLQFNLMLYSCTAAALKPGPGVVRKLAPRRVARPEDNPIPTLTGWAANQIPGAVIGWVGDQIGFPLGPKATYQAVVCASILLYSYDVQVNADPNRIWRRSQSSSNPYQSQLTATVNFNFRQDVDSLPKLIGTWAAGCAFPQNGPQDNVTVAWDITDELPQYGLLSQQDTLTRGGQAQATFEAFDETVPPVFQAMSSPKAAIGFVTVKVQNVVPKWPKLEAILRAGNPDAASGQTLLTVFYYKWPQLTLDFDSELKGSNGDPDHPDGRILASGAALQLVKGGSSAPFTYTYQGQTQETYGYFVAFQGWTVISSVGGQFQAAIPAQPNLTTDNLVVMVNVGQPQETVQLPPDPDGNPSPSETTTWFAAAWYMTHFYDRTTAAPYAGWYAIAGWQGSGSTLTRQYAGTTNYVTEATKFTLTGTPGQ